MGLTPGMVLKFYTSVVEGLKLKFRKFWGLILTFVEVTWKKLVGGHRGERGGLFAHPHPEIGLIWTRVCGILSVLDFFFFCYIETIF